VAMDMRIPREPGGRLILRKSGGHSNARNDNE
jgi:hypothetical protein